MGRDHVTGSATRAQQAAAVPHHRSQLCSRLLAPAACAPRALCSAGWAGAPRAVAKSRGRCLVVPLARTAMGLSPAWPPQGTVLSWCPGTACPHFPDMGCKSTQCCQPQGSRWARGMASPCRDGPAVPRDPGMTQRGEPGAGRAISAVAEGWEGTSHRRASPDREKKIPGDSKAGPTVCGEQGRWLARARSRRHRPARARPAHGQRVDGS